MLNALRCRNHIWYLILCEGEEGLFALVPLCVLLHSDWTMAIVWLTGVIAYSDSPYVHICRCGTVVLHGVTVALHEVTVVLHGVTGFI